METVIYTAAGVFTLAAFVSAKWGRAPGPAMLFTALALILLMVTPAGQEVLSFVRETGENAAEAGK